ncbi:MAG: crotonobetainyl-CoA--carnitine CoA-transferase, partial [Candidatus Omnitrophica bacterium]|nr:crotonobetainyl-CoA--carnitine CoA-transferase [Candidatus Omnitrophota bacterium]
MKTKKHDAIVLSSATEKQTNQAFVEHFKQAVSLFPDDEILHNLGLFINSKDLSRMLFFYEMYKKIVRTHGIIVEFGVRWGQTLAVLQALRGILEPFNRHRKIVGFDTFCGFQGMNRHDGTRCRCKDGSFSVPSGYERYLDTVLSLQEQMNPMAHLKRFELVKGNAQKTVPAYFRKHPETIVSLAIFDFDIFAPTKAALQQIK